MTHFNQVVLVGVVGSTIELRNAEGENATCSFTLGTETFGEIVWHRVRAWGYRAKLCERSFRKGYLVKVVGPLVYIKSGMNKKAEVRALEFQVLSRRGAPQDAGSNAVPTKEAT